MRVRTAQGPRSDKVHYVFATDERAVCGAGAPKRGGWRVVGDDEVNRSTYGVCERCLLRYVGPQH